MRPLAPAIMTLSLGAALAAAAFLLFRHRLPLTTFVVTVLLYVVTVIAQIPTLGAGIAAIIAAFAMASSSPRKVAFIAGGVATAAVVVLSITGAEFGSFDPRIFQIGAGIAVSCALGDSSRSRHEYLVAITERALRAEQTREADARRRIAVERLRIAQDLHDTVAHQISVISLNAGVASNALDRDPDKAREALGTIRSASRGVLGDIGELLQYLRAGDNEDASRQPQPGLGELDALVERMKSVGLNVRVSVSGELSRVVGATDQVAFRILQEGLTNAHKHGAPGEVRVGLSVAPERLSISVMNPVTSQDVAHNGAFGGGFGLAGLQERAAAIGGSVWTDTTSDLFRLYAQLPLAPDRGVSA